MRNGKGDDSPSQRSSLAINVKKEHYPNCVVWTPIHPITWFLPFVGHMGVCNGEGVIHDFAGSHYISEDDMAFGNPTRYWQLRVDDQAAWDEAVAATADHFRATQGYNFFTNNCHSFVACCMASYKYKGSAQWNMVALAALLFLTGRFVSLGRCLATVLPSLGLLLGLILYLVL